MPRADHQAQLLRQSAVKEAQFGQLDAGRFRSFISGGGDAVFYAERVDEEGVLHNVFVRRETADRVEVALADTATYSKAASNGMHFVTLFNGRRYEGVPGQSDFRVIEFREHGIPIVTPEDKLGTEQDPDTRPTRELLGSTAPEDIAQLQFRASSPIMALILTLLAVPVSRLRPRQGRYARVGFAIVVYVIYANLLSASKVWVEKGQLPPAIGVWWVHILLLAFALYLIYREGARHVNTLDRYLYRTVLLYTLMAMCVLLTLGALFVFISQQSDIGTGDYGTADAFLYTFLNLPEQIFELLPIGAMIGALMGLGNLAAGSELVVTRASGVSVWRIAWPVGLAGLTLVVDHVRGRRIRRAAACAVREARENHEQARRRELRRLEQRLGEGRQSHLAGANRRGRPILRGRLAVPAGRADQVALDPAGRPYFRGGSASLAHAQRRHDALRRRSRRQQHWPRRSRSNRPSIRTFWRSRRRTPIFSRCAASPRTSIT